MGTDSGLLSNTGIRKGTKREAKSLAWSLVLCYGLRTKIEENRFIINKERM